MSSKSKSTTTKKTSSAPAVEDNTERLAFFDSFADPDDPEVISIEGLGKMCEELGIDASSDVRALVLAMKLGAQSQPGKITREEFLTGCKSIFVNNISQVRAKIASLDPGFMDRNEFRGSYLSIDLALVFHRVIGIVLQFRFLSLCLPV